MSQSWLPGFAFVSLKTRANASNIRQQSNTWKQLPRISYTAASRKVVQQNRTRQSRKVLWEMGFMVFDWGFRCFGDIEGNITNKSIYSFPFLVGKRREPQSINAKLFLPIIPIGIVAYALTLLWDNLCRNSCIWICHFLSRLNAIYYLVRLPSLQRQNMPILWRMSSAN